LGSRRQGPVGLDKLKVPQREKDELLVIASSLKADIVEKP
jgi:hypothetical protein